MFIDDHDWDRLFPPADKANFWQTARCIYRTGIAADYAAYRMGQLRDGNYRYWVYRCHDNTDCCPAIHHELDGVAMSPDHPFWAIYSPPNGWGCACAITGARTEAGIQRVGGIVGKSLPDWWSELAPAGGCYHGIDTGFEGCRSPGLRETVAALLDGTAR